MAKEPSVDAPRSAGIAGVYLVPLHALAPQAAPWVVEGRPVRAWAPHPDLDDLIYVTVEHPETLAFLPTPYFEFD